MKPIKNYEEVKDFSEVNPLPIGPQKCQVVEVIDNPDKEYLEFNFDIVDGEYKGYFRSLANSNENNEWPVQGKFIRSYKEKALGFFKGAITAIEKTNPPYNFVATNWNEKTLVKKYVVVNFREEEYLSNEGEIKVRVRPFEFRSSEALREGKINSQPAKKLLKREENVAEPTPSVDINKAELPF